MASSIEENIFLGQSKVKTESYDILPKVMQGSNGIPEHSGELSVSFGYQCNGKQSSSIGAHKFVFPSGAEMQGSNIRVRSSSFSCLSGAALSANATLANTNICNGLIGEEILPGLDSPNSFRRMVSSPSLSRLDHMSSSHSSVSTLGGSSSTENDFFESARSLWKPMSAPTRIESSSFLNAMDVQVAGGAAGEDRVQAVCSEENEWLFCGVYDGFNGRDAADFLVATLYENIGFYLHLLEWRTRQQGTSQKVSLEGSPKVGNTRSESFLANDFGISNIGTKIMFLPHSSDGSFSSESFRLGVMDCLSRALAQAESDFMYMVEQEMEDRPDLVSVGSCVLIVLLHGNDLYSLNLGDSRAVLATSNAFENGSPEAIQLTETHTVDNEIECNKVLADHPDDPSVIVGGRVKGKLKVTRAFGVGYLKKVWLNLLL